MKDKFSNKGSDKGMDRISCFLFAAGVHAHYLAEEYPPPCLKLLTTNLYTSLLIASLNGLLHNKMALMRNPFNGNPVGLVTWLFNCDIFMTNIHLSEPLMGTETLFC